MHEGNRAPSEDATAPCSLLCRPALRSSPLPRISLSRPDPTGRNRPQARGAEARAHAAPSTRSPRAPAHLDAPTGAAEPLHEDVSCTAIGSAERFDPPNLARGAQTPATATRARRDSPRTRARAGHPATDAARRRPQAQEPSSRDAAAADRGGAARRRQPPDEHQSISRPRNKERRGWRQPAHFLAPHPPRHTNDRRPQPRCSPTANRPSAGHDTPSRRLLPAAPLSSATKPRPRGRYASREARARGSDAPDRTNATGQHTPQRTTAATHPSTQPPTYSHDHATASHDTR